LGGRCHDRKPPLDGIVTAAARAADRQAVKRLFYRNASRGSQGVSERAMAAQPLFQTRAVALLKIPFPVTRQFFIPPGLQDFMNQVFFISRLQKIKKILLTGEGQSAYRKNKPTGR
jgi:hypothetical protein